MGEADKAYERALRFLEKRDRTEKEVTDKLTDAGFSETAVTKTVNRLREDGYVNDEAYAVRYLDALENKGRGRIRIASEMRRKGLGEDLVRNTLEDNVSSADEKERAREAAKRAFGQIADKTDMRKVKAKVNRRLVTLGYSYNVIGEVINQLGNEESYDYDDED